MLNVTFQVEDLWNLSEKDRWRLYRRWVLDARKSCYEAISDLQEMFDEKVDELKDVRRQQDYEILKNADVVGMTTTGNRFFFLYCKSYSVCEQLVLLLSQIARGKVT